MDLLADGSNSLFYYCIQGLLKSWTALQLAISHSFAGPHTSEKAQWLVGVTEDFFEKNTNLEPYEVEDFLEEIILNEFNIVAEDNSIKEISVNLCKLYAFWKSGEHGKMKEYVNSLPCVNLGECITEKNNTDETIVDSNIDELAIENQNEKSQRSHRNQNKSAKIEPDADGWVQVNHRKKH